MQGHIYKACDIMERVGVSHRYSGCDGTNIVNMLLYLIYMMSTYIEDEISKIDWYDIINRVDVVTEIALIRCQI